jgi:hypothetical protein
MTAQYDKVIDQLLKGMEKPTPEMLYHQLGRVRNEMPVWSMLGRPETTKWTGRVLAIVDAAADCTMEIVSLRTYFDFAARQGSSEKTGLLIAQAIDTALAKLELKLPADMQGAFIPAGGVHDGYQACSKALRLAQKHVMLVDPYADDTLISDFVVLASEAVSVYVLTDAQTAKPSLKPAAERWIAQWAAKRPLEVRQAPAKSLHDRLIITDGSTAWVVGQSFKDLAKRAHTSLVRMDADSGNLKINAHYTMWQTATKLA